MVDPESRTEMSSSPIEFAIRCVIGRSPRESSDADAAPSIAMSLRLAPSVPWPVMSHDSFSLSGTGGFDTSRTRGTLTVPVSSTPASTARFLRSATTSSAGLSTGPSKISRPRSMSRRWPKTKKVPETARMVPLAASVPAGVVVTCTRPARRVSSPSPVKRKSRPRATSTSRRSGRSRSAPSCVLRSRPTITTSSDSVPTRDCSKLTRPSSMLMLPASAILRSSSASVPLPSATSRRSGRFTIVKSVACHSTFAAASARCEAPCAIVPLAEKRRRRRPTRILRARWRDRPVARAARRP